MTEPPEHRQSKNYLTNRNFFGTLPASLSGQKGVQVPSSPNRKNGEALEARSDLTVPVAPGSRLTHEGCLGFRR
jgi:hypothetical protein